MMANRWCAGTPRGPKRIRSDGAPGTSARCRRRSTRPSRRRGGFRKRCSGRPSVRAPGLYRCDALKVPTFSGVPIALRTASDILSKSASMLSICSCEAASHLAPHRIGVRLEEEGVGAGGHRRQRQVRHESRLTPGRIGARDSVQTHHVGGVKTHRRARAVASSEPSACRPPGDCTRSTPRARSTARSDCRSSESWTPRCPWSRAPGTDLF